MFYPLKSRTSLRIINLLPGWAKLCFPYSDQRHHFLFLLANYNTQTDIIFSSFCMILLIPSNINHLSPPVSRNKHSRAAKSSLSGKFCIGRNRMSEKNKFKNLNFYLRVFSTKVEPSAAVEPWRDFSLHSRYSLLVLPCTWPLCSKHRSLITLNECVEWLSADISN